MRLSINLREDKSLSINDIKNLEKCYSQNQGQNYNHFISKPWSALKCSSNPKLFINP